MVSLPLARRASRATQLSLAIWVRPTSRKKKILRRIGRL